MSSGLTHHYATAPDGAKLSYYSTGSGPSVLILHGSSTYALTHSELADALSSSFTAHVASRRGRGLSEPYPEAVVSIPPHFLVPSGQDPARHASSTYQVGSKSYQRVYNPDFTTAVLETDVSDLNTLIQVTGAEFLISVSSGALVVLQALLTRGISSALSSVRKVTIFEPPLYCLEHDSACDLSLLKRFEEETVTGDALNAMITAMFLAQMGPGWVPRWLMKVMAPLMFNAQEKEVEKRRAAGEESRGICTMRGLGALIRYDFAVAEGMIGEAARFTSLATDGPEILLLSGSRTPEYLKQGISALKKAIPSAKSAVVDGSGHELLCNAEMRGNPRKALSLIREFFLPS